MASKIGTMILALAIAPCFAQSLVPQVRPSVGLTWDRYAPART